mmetsp:Transcript_63461/g.112843  ORF Transcript_63461/g.112843 Transcript_63461/m.112843 type:complete len:246 (-) Transcript_63461:1964-2701(-)
MVLRPFCFSGRKTAFLPKDLEGVRWCRASFQNELADSSSHEARPSLWFVKSFCTRQDLRTVARVQAFQTCAQVHSVSQHTVLHACRGTDISCKHIALVHAALQANVVMLELGGHLNGIDGCCDGCKAVLFELQWCIEDGKHLVSDELQQCATVVFKRTVHCLQHHIKQIEHFCWSFALAQLLETLDVAEENSDVAVSAANLRLDTSSHQLLQQNDWHILRPSHHCRLKNSHGLPQADQLLRNGDR